MNKYTPEPNTKQRGEPPRPPLISFKELCALYSVSYRTMMGRMSINNAPKPVTIHHNKHTKMNSNSWYNKAEFMAWYAQHYGDVAK